MLKHDPSILTPMLALIVWTFVIWVWMYATRIPAIQRAGIDPAKVKRCWRVVEGNIVRHTPRS